MIGRPYLIGGALLAFGGWSLFIYDKGGDAREAFIRAELAEAAGQAKQEDDDRQGENATADSDRLRREIARLTRELELTHVPTNLVCDAPGSGDSVHEAHTQLFGERLPPLAGSDGE